MDKTHEDKINKYISVGLLAHVDAGKTTLSEALLYASSTIRQLGRVDHKNTVLDFDDQERSRGITIYSKQARFTWKDSIIQFVDTPGHVDFSSEMERSLQVLDYAILIISAIDGIQSHSETIWKLLASYNIPVFIFVNKMDLSYDSEEKIMQDLKASFSSSCVNFSNDSQIRDEEIALCDDLLLHKYMEADMHDEDISIGIFERKIFPVYFGSALKLDRIIPFLDGFTTYTIHPQYPDEFGARVYKIGMDEQGNRLTYLKVTGGSIYTKMKLDEDEKVDQIRIYTGNKYILKNQVEAGCLCAIKGLKKFQVGDGLGYEENHGKNLLNAIMSYRLKLEKHVDPLMAIRKIQQLVDEDPQLHIQYDESKSQIRIQVMGEVQMEILKHLLFERYQLRVEFDEGMVNYKETILDTVEGVGHFEPLRHYAEVHLLLEPLPTGSGLQFDSLCNQDELERHYQRLILTHLQEITHVGVLTGSPIDDMKISILSGKGHIKHSEGGDFRQATYRALRQGLRKATSILLEPMVHFEMKVPSEALSKVIYDLERMEASFQIDTQEIDHVKLSGRASVVQLQGYPMILRSLTKGKGILQCRMDGYAPCHNMKEVIDQIGYDPDIDINHPCDSVFCAYGSGFIVPWDQVEKYMHIPLKYGYEETSKTSIHTKRSISEEELNRVMSSIYRKKEEKKVRKKAPEVKKYKTNQDIEQKQECILVDGYNLIYANVEFQDLLIDHMDLAREELVNILNDYQGSRGCELICVFDAYKCDGIKPRVTKQGNIHVVYTKNSQTADNYIEQTTHQLAEKFNVRVVTSDNLEQLIVSGQGAIRTSSREFLKEILSVKQKLEMEYNEKKHTNFNQSLKKLREYQEIVVSDFKK